jgi:hypothetical protein
MSKAMSPYRQLGLISNPPVLKTGLILASVPPKPHRCNPPGFFARLIMGWRGKKIYPGTLWRCDECLKIAKYRVECQDLWVFDSYYLKEWVACGGEE